MATVTMMVAMAVDEAALAAKVQNCCNCASFVLNFSFVLPKDYNNPLLKMIKEFT